MALCLPTTAPSHVRSARRGKASRSIGARVTAKASGNEGKEADEASVMRFALDQMANAGRFVTAGAVLSTPLFAAVPEALAKEGEYGILEGRTAALVHPFFMFFLLGSSLWTAFLGFQWRRLRTMGDEINATKAKIPATVRQPVADKPEGQEPSQEAKELQAKVDELTEERKKLAQGGYRDKHWNWGSLLLAMGVGLAIEGGTNTYMRAGRLFPGPHLFSGAFMVSLWAIGAALIPHMQRGNNAARYTHIGVNLINIGLFLYQIPTGLKIVNKVFQFTSWP